MSDRPMRLRELLAGVFFLGVVMLGVSQNFVVYPQEKPVRETRQWHVAMIPGVNDNEYVAVRIDVVDTEGVCLYVGRTYGTVKAPTITAVPKSQLPTGTGCQ